MGLQYMPSSKACLLYNLSPFVSYLFSYFLSVEKITIKKIIGLLIGFFGFLPLLLSQSGNNSAHFSLPELLIILSVCSMSYGWIIVHKLIKEHNYEATLINGISMTCGGLLALVTSWLVEVHTPINDIVTFLGILTIIILVSNLVCHTLYTNLLKTYSPTFLSFASFISPLCAALFGWIFLHETITWQFILAGGCIITGLALFYRDEMQLPASQTI
jgi:drug/metabolite transporter (DMT)-like permease